MPYTLCFLCSCYSLYIHAFQQLKYNSGTKDDHSFIVMTYKHKHLIQAS